VHTSHWFLLCRVEILGLIVCIAQFVFASRLFCVAVYMLSETYLANLSPSLSEMMQQK